MPAFDAACRLTLLDTPDLVPLANRTVVLNNNCTILPACKPLPALVQDQMSSEKIFVLTVGLPPNHRAFEHKADPKLLEAVEAQLKALPEQLANAGIEAKNIFMGPGESC